MQTQIEHIIKCDKCRGLGFIIECKCKDYFCTECPILCDSCEGEGLLLSNVCESALA